MRRAVVWLLALTAGAAPALSQSCTLEHLNPSLPFRPDGVDELLGDWQFSCSGLGAGPSELFVFFDGPITNSIADVNGRDVTAAMAIVEGTTPETVVFQLPGGQPVPNANAFLLELRDTRIGQHLHADGVPGSVPLIISGVRGNIAAGLESRQNPPTWWNRKGCGAERM